MEASRQGNRKKKDGPQPLLGWKLGTTQSSTNMLTAATRLCVCLVPVTSQPCQAGGLTLSPAAFRSSYYLHILAFQQEKPQYDKRRGALLIYDLHQGTLVSQKKLFETAGQN